MYTLQWNPNWKSNIFIQEIAFESVVCKMAVIWSRPQGINNWWWIHASVEWNNISLVQEMACRLSATKPLTEPIMSRYQLDHQDQTSVKIESKYNDVL